MRTAALLLFVFVCSCASSLQAPAALPVGQPVASELPPPPEPELDLLEPQQASAATSSAALQLVPSTIVNETADAVSQLLSALDKHAALRYEPRDMRMIVLIRITVLRAMGAIFSRSLSQGELEASQILFDQILQAVEAEQRRRVLTAR